MQVFKTTLKLIFRSPIYLLLYIVFFGFLGLIILSNVVEPLPADSESINRDTSHTRVAIIDRDQSAVSENLAGFIGERSSLVDLEDNRRSLQDATAQNLASYILIIPENYGADFIKAARAGTTLPVMETVVNYSESEGILMDLITNEFLSSLSLTAAALPDASVADVLEITVDAAAEQVAAKPASLEESVGSNARFVFYLQWIAYPMTAGLIVLTGTIFATFQNGSLRQRNQCAPVSSTTMNSHIALGCVSLVLMTWAFLMGLSLMPQSGGVETLTSDPLAFVLSALAALVYALVPFSIGFLASQVGLRENALNGMSNIFSLAFCFLSGVFLGGTEMLGETIQTIARFIPTTWYSDAVIALRVGSSNSESLMAYAGNVGIVALFALAIFSVALLVGRMRAQSADAGGNSAAEAPAH